MTTKKKHLMTRIVYSSVVVFPKEQIENVWQIKFEAGSIDPQQLYSILQQISSQKQEYMKKTVLTTSGCFYFIHLNHQQRTFLCAIDSTITDHAIVWDFLTNLEQNYLHLKNNEIFKAKMETYNQNLANYISVDINRVDSLHAQGNTSNQKSVWKSAKSILE